MESHFNCTSGLKTNKTKTKQTNPDPTFREYYWVSRVTGNTAFILGFTKFESYSLTTNLFRI